MRVWFFIGGFLVYVSVLLGAWEDLLLMLIGSNCPARIVAVEQPPTWGFRDADLRVRYEFVSATGQKYNGQAVIAPNSGTAQSVRLAAATGQPVAVRYLVAHPTVSRLRSDDSPTAMLALLLGVFLSAMPIVLGCRVRRKLQQFDREVNGLFGGKSPDARYVGTVEGARTVFELYGPRIVIRGAEEAAVFILDGLGSEAKVERRSSPMLVIAALFIGLPLFLDAVFLLLDPSNLADGWAIRLNLLVPVGLCLAVRYSRRCDWAVFFLPEGAEIFAVPRCGPDSNRWEEFVRTVERSIPVPRDGMERGSTRP